MELAGHGGMIGGMGRKASVARRGGRSSTGAGAAGEQAFTDRWKRLSNGWESCRPDGAEDSWGVVYYKHAAPLALGGGGAETWGRVSIAGICRGLAVEVRQIVANVDPGVLSSRWDLGTLTL